MIEVLDENDNKPIFTAASSKLQCEESTKNGGSCGKVEAIDADKGNAGQVEYKILPNTETWKRRGGGLETNNMGIFNINSQTGEITLNNPGPSYWDAEQYEYVEIEVTAQEWLNKSRTKSIGLFLYIVTNLM